LTYHSTMSHYHNFNSHAHNGHNRPDNRLQV
jgi:hypothetical protein